MFRVVADQLKLRGGLVRCGTCRHVFDAIGSLTYVDDATVKSAPIEAGAHGRKAAAESPAAGSATAPKSPPPKPKEPARPITLRITPERGARVARQVAETDRSDETRGRRTRPVDAGVPTLWITERESDALALAIESASAGAGHESATDDTDVSSNTGVSHQAAHTAPAVADSTPQAAPAKRRRRSRDKPAEPERESFAASDRAVAGDEAQGNVEEAPSFLRGGESKRGFSILYSSGCVALAATIALQLTVLFRTELMTRWPALRPTLVQICGVFGCSIGWPTRAELLAIVGTELQAVPGTDVLELTAIIRNRANFKVGLPAVEVTLTDTQNRPLARKVFAPVDYLVSAGEPSSRIDEGLGAGSDYTVRIVFEARGLPAAGFVVYPFYL
jgi:predicted Zn finger-like uncharacterized protein